MQLHNTVSSSVVGYTIGLLLVGSIVLVDSRSRRTSLLYLALFTWFFTFQATIFWFLNVFPLPSDSFAYYEKINAIYSSGFDPLVVTDILGAIRFDTAGRSTFILIEAFLFGPILQHYIIFQSINIAIGVVAIYFAAESATYFYGKSVRFYVVLAFLIYFSWYWTVLQGLREALLFFCLGVGLRAFLKWWHCGLRRQLIICISFCAAAVLLRPEQILGVLVAVPLALLFRGRDVFLRSVLVATVLPFLALAGLRATVMFTSSDPIGYLRLIRRARIEDDPGLVLQVPPLQSISDIFLQLPQTLRFFLVPIYPWQVGTGRVYLRQYAHSLTAITILAVCFYGVYGLFKGRWSPEVDSKAFYSVFQGVLTVTMVFSLIDIGAGGAARHSALFYYTVIIFLFPAGIQQVRSRLRIST